MTVSTLEALSADPELAEAWRLQQALSQILGAAFDDRPDPDQEPDGFRERLAKAAGFPDFDALRAGLAEARKAARVAFEAAPPPVGDGT